MFDSVIDSSLLEKYYCIYNGKREINFMLVCLKILHYTFAYFLSFSLFTFINLENNTKKITEFRIHRYNIEVYHKIGFENIL